MEGRIGINLLMQEQEYELLVIDEWLAAKECKDKGVFVRKCLALRSRSPSRTVRRKKTSKKRKR